MIYNAIYIIGMYTIFSNTVQEGSEHPVFLIHGVLNHIYGGPSTIIKIFKMLKSLKTATLILVTIFLISRQRKHMDIV